MMLALHEIEAELDRLMTKYQGADLPAVNVTINNYEYMGGGPVGGGTYDKASTTDRPPEKQALTLKHIEGFV